MFCSNCCFLICIQVSQETAKVVWYSHLLKNFLQFIVIQTVKGFSVINEADVSVEFPCFLHDPTNTDNLISGSSAFYKPRLNIWKFLVHICWSLACETLSMTLLAQETSAIAWWLEHSFVLPFLGSGMRIEVFQSCGHCWVFQICWHIECSTLMAPSFRVLNSSPRILSHPLASLTAVLPKAHLTSHSRMSGSGWLTMPSE